MTKTTATAAQTTTIVTMATERGWDKDKAQQMAAKLTKAEASVVIDSLKRQPKVQTQTATTTTCPDGCCSLVG